MKLREGGAYGVAAVGSLTVAPPLPSTASNDGQFLFCLPWRDVAALDGTGESLKASGRMAPKIDHAHASHTIPIPSSQRNNSQHRGAYHATGEIPRRRYNCSHCSAYHDARPITSQRNNLSQLAAYHASGHSGKMP